MKAKSYKLKYTPTEEQLIKDLSARNKRKAEKKTCYEKCRRCAWKYNGGCSEWR